MNRRTGAALALLLVITAAVYIPSVDGEFVFDDAVSFASTLWVKDIGTFASVGTWWTLVRPVTSFTFALNHAAFGFDTRGWHLTNIAIHLAAVILAWAVAGRVLARAGLRSPEKPALAAAAIFALHPLQTEAVSYLTQRGEALASAFWLGGLLLLAASDEVRGPRRVGLAAAAIPVHLVGLGAKPIAATLPAAWLLLAAMLPPEAERDDPLTRRLARRLPVAVPLLVLSGIAAVLATTSVHGSGHAGFGIRDISLATHFATQLRALPGYLLAIAWPAGQTADRAFAFSSTFLDPGVLAGGATLVGLAGVSLWLPRRLARVEGDAAAGRAAAFAFLLFLVVLSPTTVVPLRDPFVEHRVYLATLAVAIAASASTAAALRRTPPHPVLAGLAATCVVAALATATALRNRVWQDELSLWTDAVAKTPAKGRPHAHLGLVHQQAGQLDDALREYDRALALRDPTAQTGVIVQNVTLILIRLGRLDEARKRLIDHLAVVHDLEAVAMLGTVELEAGRLDVAERLALEVIGDDAETPLAISARARGSALLGEVRERRGDLVGAARSLAEAVRIDPALPAASYALGRVQEKLGRLADACAAYARAAGAPVAGASRQRARAAFARLRCGAGP